MHFIRICGLILGASAPLVLAQDDASSLQASLSSMAANLQSSASAEMASATSNMASVSSAASSAIYSLTHCNPSFASFYHSITSVLSTETDSASLSALESSLASQSNLMTAGCISTSTTLSTTTTGSGAASTGAASTGSKSASGSAAAATASTGEGSFLTPAMGLGGAVVLGLAAWL